ncbi:MAG: 23S rRNA (guanosine(2251)-2'-O)-methyltransferase RlmB [Desulfobacteraceae bacterium]|nr:MAG: 23S rRNA (guanosine(2251)-2'-O)-methyltransferase RlmB [Desulfobacteraceae bacterium]
MAHSPNFPSRHHLIPGYRPVLEALLSNRMRILEIWIREGKEGTRANDIIAAAAERSVQVSFKSAREMDQLLPGVAHQGIAAVAGEYVYASLDEIVAISASFPEEALILAADHITDEGNLGALVRTGTFFGAHGMLLPKDRSASISAAILKRSSGALLSLPVARVVNLGRALVTLKEKGFWIIGTAGESKESIYDFDWKRNLVLVMGSEDKGLSPLIRGICDQIVKIPGSGRVESLNVSVAAGAVLSEIQRRRST